MELDGYLTLSENHVVHPEPGTIRWDGSDFVGYNGYRWISLTGGTTDSLIFYQGLPYGTVKIGSQTWMKRNLTARNYNDGTPIPDVRDDQLWATTNAGARCAYNNNPGIGQRGYLYNWYAIKSGKICPEGWKVPRIEDWQILIDYLGGPNSAGGKMKKVNEGFYDDWNGSNVGATNDSGFRAVPAGYRFHTGLFLSLTNWAIYWAYNFEEEETKLYTLLNTDHEIFDGPRSKNWGASVRCVKE